MEENRQSGGSQQRQRSASMFGHLYPSTSYITPIQTQVQQNYNSTFPFPASDSFFEPSAMDLERNPSSTTSTQFDSFVADYSQQYPNNSTAEHHHRHQQQQQQQQHPPPHITAKPYNDITTPFPLNFVNRNKLQDRNNFSGKQKGKQEHVSENVGCYWAIISTRLSDTLTHLPFLHLDPSLDVESLIGTSMLNFIHPNEATRIEFIILQYIFQEEKRGKMIHCTMKSISLMNDYVDSKLNSNNFDQVTNIRIECIGDEMILCFFHTIEDRSKQDYNQMEKKRLSTFCESSLNTFDERHFQLLWQHIYTKSLPEPFTNTVKRHQTGFPSTIFQILSNPPDSHILFSWPPPRLFNSMMDDSNSTGTEMYNDGSYFADVFARSTSDTNLREENFNLSQLMTNCTKRQIRSNTIKSDGLTIDFEAMIIPIGEIKFAIFSISRAEHVSQAEEQSIDFRQFKPSSFITNSAQERDNQYEQAFFSQSQPNQTTFPMNIASFQPMTNAGSLFLSPVPQILFSTPSTKMIDNADLSEYGRRASSHFKSLSNNNTFSQLQPIQAQDEQKRQGINMSLYYSAQDNSSSSSTLSSFPFYSRPRSFTFSESSPSTKSCLTCGTSKSPEWRKGPDGNKSLCNACGLRFSRNASRVKKKEEEARNAAEVAANGGVIPAHLRKRFQDEKDRKRNSSQKVQRQQQSQSSLQQAANQQDINNMTTFVNLSPELQSQIPNLLFASSSPSQMNPVDTTTHHRIVGSRTSQDFIPDSDTDINEEFI